jgi:hypothetical protein
MQKTKRKQRKVENKGGSWEKNAKKKKEREMHCGLLL